MKYIRPEARPLEWASLDQAQQAAFLRILQMLDECVAALPKTVVGESSPRKRQWVDEQKSNRLAFLSGGRGTGKTTVLLTLYQSCRDPATLAIQREQSEIESVPKTVRTTVERLQSRVLWLEPIDMETMPPGSNLLAAILARISNAVQPANPGGKDAEPVYRGLLEPHPDFQRAQAELQRLRANVSVAWDGNIVERKGSLDTDAYAMEVMRVEEARLGLLPTLAQVLDDLAVHAFRGSHLASPLFVLPVDDFDLNPVACLSLLRLLRLISVPRLFTLVLGDVSVAEVILNLKMSNNLAEVHSSGTIPNIPLMDDMMRVAGEVSANAIRKLIPPAHRVILPTMTALETLNFRPLGAGTEPRLCELLGRCPIRLAPLSQNTKVGARDVSLRDFLLQPGRTPQETKEAEVAQQEHVGNPAAGESSPKMTSQDLAAVPYCGLKFLDATPRRVADLWFGVQNVATTTTVAEATDAARGAVIDFFAENCRATLFEERALTPEARRAAFEAFVPSPSGNWTLSGLPLYVQSQSGQTDDYPFSQTHGDEQYDVRFTFGRGGGWRIEVELELPVDYLGDRKGPGSDLGRRFAQQRKRCPELSAETAGAIVLFHDLLALGPDRRRLHARLIHWDIGDQWAVVEWRLGSQQQIKFRWPPPPGNSFHEFDHFLFTWRSALEQIAQMPKSGLDPIKAAAFHWINAGTSVLDQEPPVAASATLDTKHWKSLQERLERLVSAVGDHRSAFDKAAAWLSDVAIITMPERGLPSDVHGLLAPEGSELQKYWTGTTWRNIRRRRGVRLAEMIVSGLPELAGSFRNPAHISKRLWLSEKYLAKLAEDLRHQPGMTQFLDEAYGDDEEPESPPAPDKARKPAAAKSRATKGKSKK